MGRPIKSTADHIKDGTYRQDRHANRGITFEALKEVPIPLELTKEAADKWQSIVPELFEKGLVTTVDIPELTAAFIHYGTAQECLRWVNDHFDSHAEYLNQLPHNERKGHLLDNYTMHMDQYNKIMHKFGATPMERAKIRVEKKKDDETDNFIKQMMMEGA